MLISAGTDPGLLPCSASPDDLEQFERRTVELSSLAALSGIPQVPSLPSNTITIERPACVHDTQGPSSTHNVLLSRKIPSTISDFETARCGAAYCINFITVQFDGACTKALVLHCHTL